MLRWMIAFPESRRVLWLHIGATFLTALHGIMLAMIPVLLRDQFGAGKIQTALSTAAYAFMFVLTVIWSELYRRSRVGAYLWIVWGMGMAPMACIALCHQAWLVLVCIIVSAIGMAGATPLVGEILRACYPPNARSKVHGLLTVIGTATTMVGTYAIGVWLDHNPQAFRTYMPIGSAIAGLGIVLYHRITRQSLFQERLRHQPEDSFVNSLRQLRANMVRIFREDPDFRRYEGAFFTYGLGWMACAALLPFLVLDVLHLSYQQIALSTQTVFQLGVMLTIMPIGYLMDRHGPIRLAIFGFFAVALYPLGLIFAQNVVHVTLITIWYAVGMSAVSLAWTIGPVTLAPNASQAGYYLAIHTTLVGIRTLIGQSLAVAIYILTQNIYLPLALAGCCFAGGGLLMYRLERLRTRTLRQPLVPGVTPATPPRAP